MIFEEPEVEVSLTMPSEKDIVEADVIDIIEADRVSITTLESIPASDDEKPPVDIVIVSPSEQIRSVSGKRKIRIENN